MAALTAFALLALVPAVSARPTEIQPDAVDFGDVIVESPGKTLAVEIANTTDGPLLLHDLLITAVTPFSTGETAAFKIVSDRCSDELLAAGEKCTVDVRFRPRAGSPWGFSRFGMPNAISNLRYTTFDGLTEASRSRQLVGTALTPAALHASHPERAFPGVRIGLTSTHRPIRFEKTGSAPLQVGPSVIEGADADSFALWRDGCVGTFSRPFGCSVWVTFKPSRKGRHTAILALHGTPSGTLRVALTGTGKPGFDAAVRRRTRLAARRLAGGRFLEKLGHPRSVDLGWHRWPAGGTVRARLVLAQRGRRRVLARNRDHRVRPWTWRRLELRWGRRARQSLTGPPRRVRMALVISLDVGDGLRLTARHQVRALTR